MLYIGKYLNRYPQPLNLAKALFSSGSKFAVQTLSQIGKTGELIKVGDKMIKMVVNINHFSPKTAISDEMINNVWQSILSKLQISNNDYSLIDYDHTISKVSTNTASIVVKATIEMHTQLEMLSYQDRYDGHKIAMDAMLLAKEIYPYSIITGEVEDPFDIVYYKCS